MEILGRQSNGKKKPKKTERAVAPPADKKNRSVKGKSSVKGKKSGAASVEVGAAELVGLRNEFLNDQNKRQKVSLIIQIVACVIIGVSAGISVFKDRIYVYFAVNEQNQIKELVALSEPNMKAMVVGDWARKAIMETLNYVYDDQKTHLNNMFLKHFTSAGGDMFLNAWEASGYASFIREKRVKVDFVTDHAPLLLREGIPPGSSVWAWQFEMTGLLTMRSLDAETYSAKLRVIVTVTRTSLLEDDLGVRIAQVIIRSI